MTEFILLWNCARNLLDKSRKKQKLKENILKNYKEIRMLITYKTKKMEI